MLKHSVVKKVLVDRSQFVLELSLEMVDDLRVALHAFSLFFKGSIVSLSRRGASKPMLRRSACV
jgi:hypothetical protein